MTMMTRRGALTGAAAIAAGAVSGAAVSPAAAAAPPAGKQVAGVYRYKVGSLELSVVTDGVRVVPLADTFVKNASKEQVSGALQTAYLAPDKIVTPYNPILVNNNGKLTLIDTGLGEATFAESKGALGQMNSNLAAAGVDLKAIDQVIITHCHPDHINGLVTADGKPAFANAEVFVPAAELKYWNDDAAMGRAPDGSRPTSTTRAACSRRSTTR